MRYLWKVMAEPVWSVVPQAVCIFYTDQLISQEEAKARGLELLAVPDKWTSVEYLGIYDPLEEAPSEGTLVCLNGDY